MGNRAYIVFSEKNHYSPAIYLHWNGGPESVYSFINVLNYYRVPRDADYRCARFVQLVGNYFGGTLSLGVHSFTRLEELDCGDNGLYVFDEHDHVRRYIDDWRGGTAGIEWQSEEWIATERAAAINHEYNCHPLNNISENVMRCNDKIFKIPKNEISAKRPTKRPI